MDRRSRWLARLGEPVDLDYTFFAVGEVFPRSPGRTVVTGELGTGHIGPNDELEAVGYGPAPVPVRVERVERPHPVTGAIVEVDRGNAGDVLGLTLAHEPALGLVIGQCLASTGRLRAATVVEADVWIVEAADLPCIPEEQTALFDEIGEGRGLELFFHTRSVSARMRGEWRPALGEEYRLTFDLAAAVPLYEGARFGVRARGLTIGIGFPVG